MVGARPGDAALHVAGKLSDRMIIEQPHRDAVASKAAGDAEADMRTADDQRAGRLGHACSRSGTNAAAAFAGGHESGVGECVGCSRAAAGGLRDAPRGKSGAGDEAQQRPETGDGGGADEMQPANARCKSGGENRKAAVPGDAAAQ